MDIFYKEPTNGNLEYKLNLNKMNHHKFQKYSSQLKYRILEGNGVAIYIIGIHDNGKIIGLNQADIPKTKQLFSDMCENVQCKIDIILNCKCKSKLFLIIKISALFDIDNLSYII